MLSLRLVLHRSSFLPVIILRTVTFFIYYDEKVTSNKPGGLNKLREGGKIFLKIINVHPFVLGTEEYGLFMQCHVNITQYESSSHQSFR